MRLVAESALVEAAPHTLPVPWVTRCGDRMSTVDTRDGGTAGRTRYVRVQTSAVLISWMIVPIAMPRGYVPPSPDVYTVVPVLSSTRVGMWRSSSRYDSPRSPRPRGYTM